MFDYLGHDYDVRFWHGVAAKVLNHAFNDIDPVSVEKFFRLEIELDVKRSKLDGVSKNPSQEEQHTTVSGSKIDNMRRPVKVSTQA